MFSLKLSLRFEDRITPVIISLSYTLKLISWEKTRAGDARAMLPVQMPEITKQAKPTVFLSARGVTIILKSKASRKTNRIERI